MSLPKIASFHHRLIEAYESFQRDKSKSQYSNLVSLLRDPLMVQLKSNASFQQALHSIQRDLQAYVKEDKYAHAENEETEGFLSMETEDDLIEKILFLSKDTQEKSY